MKPIHVSLSQPLGPISSLTVRIPEESSWDNPPPGVSEAMWNLSRSTGLTVEQASTLSEADIAQIAAAFEAAVNDWNTAQSALRRSGQFNR